MTFRVVLICSVFGAGCLWNNNPRQNVRSPHPGALAYEQDRKDEQARMQESQARRDAEVAKLEEENRAAREQRRAEASTRALKFHLEEQERKKEEEAQKAAAEERKRDQEWKDAVAAGTCKKDSSRDDCEKQLYLAQMIADACGLIASIEESHATARSEKKQAARFGVVDLSHLQELKESVARDEETLADRKNEIKEIRGKAFSKSECK